MWHLNIVYHTTFLSYWHIFLLLVAKSKVFLQVIETFQLKICEDQLMSRCTKCNGRFIHKPLTTEEAVEAAKGFQVIPNCLFNKNLEFWQCMDCNQLYWEVMWVRSVVFYLNCWLGFCPYIYSFMNGIIDANSPDWLSGPFMSFICIHLPCWLMWQHLASSISVMFKCKLVYVLRVPFFTSQHDPLPGLYFMIIG